MSSSLIFATRNVHKVEDARKLLPDYDIQQVDFDIPEIQSMHIREIISAKLQYAYRQLLKPCFVMDASLSFQALEGFPGPLIRWFYETVGSEKIVRIIESLSDSRCTWETWLGYFDGSQEHYFSQALPGNVPPMPRGENGYHWDTLFIPEKETRTLAEMTFEEKQQYAPTRKLLGELRNHIEKHKEGSVLS